MATKRKAHRMCFEEQVIQFGLHLSVDLVKEAVSFIRSCVSVAWWGILVSIELLTILCGIAYAYLYKEFKPWIDECKTQKVELSQEEMNKIREFSRRESKKNKDKETKRMEAFVQWKYHGVPFCDF